MAAARAPIHSLILRGTGHQGEILLRQTRLEPEARGRDGACPNIRAGNVWGDC